jgi:hypothetical protein
MSNEEAKQRRWLMPTGPPADRLLVEDRQSARLEITPDELDLLQRYVEFIRDDRVLLVLHEAEPKQIGLLRDSLRAPDDYYQRDGRSCRNVPLLVRRVLDYFSLRPR